MRKMVLLLMGVWACSSVALGAFDVTISSGYHGTQRLEGEESLLMTGGGVVGIDAYDASYVEIQNTAPYQVNVGGIHDLDLNQNSTMIFFGGEVRGIDIYGNANASLRGGQIGSIESFQDADDLVQVGWDEENNVPIFRKHIEMIVREWSHNTQTNLLTGIWNVDSDNDDLFDTFGIQLHDQAGYDPVMENITFTIIPEPMTLLFFGFGGLAVRGFRKRS